MDVSCSLIQLILDGPSYILRGYSLKSKKKSIYFSENGFCLLIANGAETGDMKHSVAYHQCNHCLQKRRECSGSVVECSLAP